MRELIEFVSVIVVILMLLFLIIVLGEGYTTEPWTGMEALSGDALQVADVKTLPHFPPQKCRARTKQTELRRSSRQNACGANGGGVWLPMARHSQNCRHLMFGVRPRAQAVFVSLT